MEGRLAGDGLDGVIGRNCTGRNLLSFIGCGGLGNLFPGGPGGPGGPGPGGPGGWCICGGGGLPPSYPGPDQYGGGGGGSGLRSIGGPVVL